MAILTVELQDEHVLAVRVRGEALGVGFGRVVFLETETPIILQY